MDPMKKDFLLLILGLTFFTSFSCTTVEGVQLRVNHDALVQEGDETPKSLKAGDTILMTDQPFQISGQSKVPILVVPSSIRTRLIEVDLEDLAKNQLKDLIGPGPRGSSPDEINQLLDEINLLQSLLNEGKPQGALVIVDKLKAQFPDVAYLDLIKASCLYLAQDLNGARASLELALKHLPQNLQAQKVLELLKSKPSGNSM